MASQYAGRGLLSREPPEERTEFSNMDGGISVSQPSFKKTAQERSHFLWCDIVVHTAACASRWHVFGFCGQQTVVLDPTIKKKVEHEIRAQREGLVVNDNQSAEWDFVVPEHVDAGENVGVGFPSRDVTTLAIVNKCGAVKADTHGKTVVPQKTGPFSVKASGIGLQRVSYYLAFPLQTRLRMDCFFKEWSAEQGRLATMPDEFDAVVQRVLQDLSSHRRHHWKSHDLIVTYAPVVTVGAA